MHDLRQLPLCFVFKVKNKKRLTHNAEFDKDEIQRSQKEAGQPIALRFIVFVSFLLYSESAVTHFRPPALNILLLLIFCLGINRALIMQNQME
jgi:hypothetical protein